MNKNQKIALKKKNNRARAILSRESETATKQ